MFAFVCWWIALILNIVGGVISFANLGESDHPAAGLFGWLIGNALSVFIFYCAWQYLAMP